jgi:hypothetical protein
MRTFGEERSPRRKAPPWPCPRCKKGILLLVKHSLKSVETVNSVKAHNEDAWEPEWTEYTFSCWLKCALANCGESVAVIGRGTIEGLWDPEAEEAVYLDSFRPVYMRPMPDVFTLSNECPEQVSAALRASFRLIWSDAGAAAGRVRVAVEHLLTFVGIKKRMRMPGIIKPLTLHRRIEILSKTQPTIANNLMAVKWFGNIGSHETEATFDDLMAAYGIIEHAVDELIGRRSQSIAATAKGLTKKHAPRKR